MRSLASSTLVLLLAGGSLAAADQVSDIIAQATLPEYQSYLRVLTGVDPVAGDPPWYLESRYSFSTDIWQAAQWIKSGFEAAGLDASFHRWDTYCGPNVIAELRGTQHPENIYVVCAHYDTYHELDQLHAPGCDDNASGTAAVMMAARVLSQYQFGSTLRFIAFSGEEQWMLGSDAYVRRARQLGENIVAAINWDMILHPSWDRATGDPSHYLHVEKNAASQWLASYMAGQVATYTSLTPRIDTDFYDAGDHAAFWWSGYSAIDLIEHTAPQIWWEGANAEYHQLTDTFDNPHIDWDFGLQTVQAGMAGLINLAGLVPEPGGALAMLLLVAVLRPRRASRSTLDLRRT